MELLKNNMMSKSHTLKSLSDTRWSSRESSCLSLNENWSAIITTLKSIINDQIENNITRNEARELLNKIGSLETIIMSVV